MLDNPVWYALGGPLERFTECSADGLARRFDVEVSPFSAVDRVDDRGWAALADLVGPAGIAVLFRDEVPASPAGWTELFRISGYQMVARDLPDAPKLEARPLVAADAQEVMALIELTEPGPFQPRTLELGTYIGVHQEGRLVAMAGQRFQVPGWCEISAVCAHPDVQRQGLGAATTLLLAALIREQGNQVLLHVVVTNDKAVSLYKKLGFDIRRTVAVVGNQWQAPAAEGLA
jgi:predicted GNAT family acetyltransferase